MVADLVHSSDTLVSAGGVVSSVCYVYIKLLLTLPLPSITSPPLSGPGEPARGASSPAQYQRHESC